MAAALDLYRRLARLPGGRWLFSKLVSFRAPYFSSINPRFDVLEPERSVLHMKKRRAVTNHIGTVHAIAMANLCELGAGTVTEVTIPRSMRWIPKRMTIEYLSKAETHVRAVCTVDTPSEGTTMELPVHCNVYDTTDRVVVRATITMWVTPRPAR